MLIPFKDKHPNTLSQATITKRNQQLHDISLAFNGDGIHIDTTIFDKPDFFDILHNFLRNFKDHTKRSYYYCLMCFSENHNCNLNTHLKLRNLYNQSNPISNTTADPHAFDKIDRLLAADNHNCKILHAILSHVGAIRLFELINTTLIDLPNKNFLDLNNKLWIFRASATKQKKDRIINIHTDFINSLKPLLNNNTHLFTRKNGLPYNSSGALSALIKKYTGLNFLTIRRSDVHLNLAKNGISHKHANTLGHSLNTQLNKYANLKNNESIKIKPIVKIRDK